MGCPRDEQLLAGESGALAHAQHCARCQGVLSGVDTLDATLDSQKTLQRERPADDALGDGSLVGAYVVSRRIGAGAMGAVYAAFDPRLEREVALKVLHVGGDLVGEARLLAKLNHPNVVTVHEVLTWQGRVVLVMELARGLTLRQWLQAKKRTPAELRDVFGQCAKGLAAAHAQGVIHRDFKPDNVLVDETGRARLLDFGLATPVETGGMGLAGSPAYMALAQLERAPADAASDQFSWWASLYEALAGRVVHDGPTLADLLVVRRAGAVDLSAVPRPWRAALARGLSNEPSRRFPSMEAAARAIAPANNARWVAFGLAAAVAAVIGFSLLTAPAPCELSDVSPAQWAARARVPALVAAVDSWRAEQAACLRLPRVEQEGPARCLAQAGVELDLALEALDTSPAPSDELAPRLLRRVMPAARCARRPLPPLVHLESDRAPLIASLRDQLAFDALRVADDSAGALAFARGARARAEAGPSVVARLWAGINEAAAMSATGDAHGALKVLRSLRAIPGSGPREQAWVAIGVWLFECYASGQEHCAAAQHDAKRLAAEVDEPWVRAFEVEVGNRMDSALPVSAPAEAWARIPGADWEVQRALAGATISSTTLDDMRETRRLVELLKQVRHPISRLRALGLDLQLQMAVRDGDEATALAFLEQIDAIDGDPAIVARMRLYSRLNYLSGTGRFDAALALIENPSPLTQTQRLVMVMNYLEVLESPRFASVAEQVALVEPLLSEPEALVLEEARLRRAFRLGDVKALEDLEVAPGEERLREWQLATLRGDPDAARAVLEAAEHAPLDDEVRLLRVYALVGRGDDAAVLAECAKALDEVSSYQVQTNLRLLLAGAHWRRGERTEACTAMTSHIWFMPMLPADRALAATVFRACPAFAMMKLPATR